jgi:hypothetical protein
MVIMFLDTPFIDPEACRFAAAAAPALTGAVLFFVGDKAR